MQFVWYDYDRSYSLIADNWLDDTARKHTGIDSWDEFYTYWLNNTNIENDEFFWSKLVFIQNTPIALIAIGLHNCIFTISAMIVSPGERNKGYGSLILKELITHSRSIIGKSIDNANAIIFPDNIASQKAFTNAGFIFANAHPDGDALYYIYQAPGVLK